VNTAGVAALSAIVETWKRTGRPVSDLHAASLLTAAALGMAARIAGDLPVEAWAEANRIAQDPTSLINTSPELKAPHG
jgi:hypothetical protein